MHIDVFVPLHDLLQPVTGGHDVENMGFAAGPADSQPIPFRPFHPQHQLVDTVRENNHVLVVFGHPFGQRHCRTRDKIRYFKTMFNAVMDNRIRVVRVRRADRFDIERVVVKLIDEGGIFGQAAPPCVDDLNGRESRGADDFAAMTADKLPDDYVSGTRPNIGFRHMARRFMAMPGQLIQRLPDTVVPAAFPLAGYSLNPQGAIFGGRPRRGRSSSSATARSSPFGATARSSSLVTTGSA